MELIELDATAQRALELLTNAGMSDGSIYDYNSVIDTERLTVRRLTPLECERLQGFPDGWTDIGAWVGENGKSHAESADTARYKALGNSIALPPWAYVLTRLSLCVGCGHPQWQASLTALGAFR